MPVTTPGRIRRRGHTRAAVATVLLGVLVATGLVVAVVRFISRAPDKVNLGPRVFSVGRADRLAARVEQDGPLLFNDTLRRGRDIYVQHIGARPRRGWHAFEAYAPETVDRPGCLLEWQRESGEFRDPCTRTRYPADGTGLVRYKAVVERGTVVVDLRVKLE